MHVRMMTVHDHTNSYAYDDAKIQGIRDASYGGLGLNVLGSEFEIVFLGMS